VVEKNPNVFIDTAAYLYEIPQILTRETVERIGRDRIVFGTDYPMPYVGQVHQMKDFVEVIQGLDLPDDDLEGILCGNVEHLLKGRPETHAGPDFREFLEDAARHMRPEPNA
jgi:predicted TIM-barrel fold metal-dependent hydrolase